MASGPSNSLRHGDGAQVESAHDLRIAPDCAIGDAGPSDLVMVSASRPLPAEWMARHATVLLDMPRLNQSGYAILPLARPHDLAGIAGMSRRACDARRRAPSIQQVGLAVGYEDAGFFLRVFKRHSGMTPAA